MTAILLNNDLYSGPLSCVSDAAAGFWLRALCLAVRTGGHLRVSAKALQMYRSGGRRWRPLANELAEAGIATWDGEWLELIRFTCAGRDAFRIQYGDSWSKVAYPEVIARDGMACRYCGSDVDEKNMHIDHVRPRCQGGGDGALNLVVACRGCNQKKSGRTPEQAGMALRSAPGSA